jgi:hypothetical protein
MRGVAAASIDGRQPTMVKVEQVIYPACVCGRPWPEHAPVDRPCQGYRPARPVAPLGVVSYTHKKWICRVLYRLERWALGHREACERRP